MFGFLITWLIYFFFQFQAQFYIIEKIKTEVGFIRIADVHLRSEIAVPKPLIGRIIGKGGQHVSDHFNIHLRRPG